MKTGLKLKHKWEYDRRYQKIPDSIFYSIKDYVEDRRAIGGFLQAVLSNNLMESATRADGHSFESLGVIALFIFNHVPCQCYGSPEKVKQWLEDVDAVG
jgi:hypothetical protein